MVARDTIPDLYGHDSVFRPTRMARCTCDTTPNATAGPRPNGPDAELELLDDDGVDRCNRCHRNVPMMFSFLCEPCWQRERDRWEAHERQSPDTRRRR